MSAPQNNVLGRPVLFATPGTASVTLTPGPGLQEAGAQAAREKILALHSTVWLNMSRGRPEQCSGGHLASGAPGDSLPAVGRLGARDRDCRAVRRVAQRRLQAPQGPGRGGARSGARRSDAITSSRSAPRRCGRCRSGSTNTSASGANTSTSSRTSSKRKGESHDREDEDHGHHPQPHHPGLSSRGLRRLAGHRQSGHALAQLQQADLRSQAEGRRDVLFQQGQQGGGELGAFRPLHRPRSAGSRFNTPGCRPSPAGSNRS